MEQSTALLPTCPRCGSFVYRGWTTCKICGFDPENSLTHTSFTPPPHEKAPIKWGEVFGGIAVLVTFAVLAYVGVRIGIYVWQNGGPRPERQEWVTIPHS